MSLDFTTWLTSAQRDWATAEEHSIDSYSGRKKKVIDGHDQRQGQFYFNRLYRERPELADAIRCTLQDPFNNDDRIPGFLTVIGDLWDEPFGDNGEPLA